ncbi:MAG: IS21-like element helper ATPase IstB [Acidimicrobiales bacterium]
MSEATTSLEVIELCRRLRLPYLRQSAHEVLTTAKAQRWDPAEVVRVLLEAEVQGRDSSMTESRRRRAGFPTGKTFDAWQEQRSSVSPATQRALATLEWVDRHENLVICGPSGTGKSHLLEALGQSAIDAKKTVVWYSIEDLGLVVRRHRIDDTVAKGLAPILRADVIVIDDIGLLPITEDAAEGLYRVIDAAYERRSVAISSNLHPSGFDELMPPSLATALVDRLLHHAHVVQTSGESIRLQDATSGKGVKPLGR